VIGWGIICEILITISESVLSLKNNFYCIALPVNDLIMQIVFLIFSLVLLNTIFVNAQDWPGWRGPNRDGVFPDTGLVERFDSNVPEKKWSAPVGSGYSGPTVAAGKVFLTDLIEGNVQTEGVLCFDEKTGEKLWEFRYDCIYEGVGYPAGPRASVIYEKGKIWSLGTMGHLFCFDAGTGDVIWQKDLNVEYNIKMPIWGIAASPLIDEEKIIVQIGGSDGAGIVAFNKNTGNEIWRNLQDGASYSAPVIAEKNGRKVLVAWTEEHLAGMDPENGEVFWKFPWKLKMAMGISTPVISNDYLFVSSFYNGSLLIHLGDDYTTAKKVWQRSGESERNTDALHCVMNTPVIIGDYIYGVDSYGELRCLELQTGDRVWEDLSAVNKNRWANIHFIQIGENTWMFNEHGELLITRLSPQGLQELSRAKIIDTTQKQLPRGVTWAHPAFSSGYLFVRNDHELISVRLTK
jgi:outer membrane protein assembly factor BamB